MSTLTLSPVTTVLPPPPVVDLPEGGVHLTCCDLTIALCGFEMRGDGASDDEEATTCVDCILIDAQELPCGQPGCDVGDPDLARLAAELAATAPQPSLCTDPQCPGSVDAVPDPTTKTRLCTECSAAAFVETVGGSRG